MDDDEQARNAKKVDRIRELNDSLRTTGTGGRTVLSLGVANLPPEMLSLAIRAVQSFADFTQGNDPWGEHDFGQVAVAGETIMWKIDCYDINLEWGSPDPADETVSSRVMTIMLPSEY